MPSRTMGVKYWLRSPAGLRLSKLDKDSTVRNLPLQSSIITLRTSCAGALTLEAIDAAMLISDLSSSALYEELFSEYEESLPECEESSSENHFVNYFLLNAHFRSYKLFYFIFYGVK
jgi:hypothetical protein